MMKKDLAEALGISSTMVTKLERRGMPTTSVQAARVWRDKHLHPGYRKEYKLGGYRKPQRRVQQQHDVDPDRALDAVELLGTAAALMMRAGQPLTALEPLLRDALRQVPVEHRDRLVLRGTGDEMTKLCGQTGVRGAPADADVRPFPVIVWHALVAPVMTVVQAEQDKLSGPVELSDDEANVMAEFWYQAAAGEVVPA